jgi:hypothetical protein
MATASSQPFGNLLASNFQGFAPSNYSNAFKTKLDPTLTAPVTQGPMLGVLGSMGGFGGQDFQAAVDVANAIPNENARGMAIASLFGNQMRQQSDNQMVKNYAEILDMIEQRQYANRLKARPLEFQELVAKNLLKTITDIPGQIANAGQMYGREAATAFGRQTENFQAPQVVKYF